MRSRIVFSQIREMFGYLSFDACIVSCGTCREALIEQEVENIFHAKVTDISKFVLDTGITLNKTGACLYRRLYHTPCHDSMEGQAVTILEDSEINVESMVDHCCSEAGTLALSRPDTSSMT